MWAGRRSAEAGFALVQQGEEERGAALPREVVAAHEGWAKLLALMTPADASGLERARVLLEIQGAAGDGPRSVGSGR